MTQWGAPTLVALFAGFGLAAVLFVPYVAISYRRRGELGFGRSLAAVGFLVYCFALVSYTLLPQPVVDATYCATHEALRHPVLNPLRFLDDMRQYQTSVLANPALRQVLFNVALFVPWGVFVRKFFGRGIPTAIVSGLVVSLAVETTQLTGVWWLFACPYRLFDTGDLASNTLGAAVGAVLASVVRTHAPRLAADQPRPVRTARRLLGMLLDLITVVLLGSALTVLVQAAYYVLADPPHLPDISPGWNAVLGSWGPAVLLLLIVPLAGNGATPGQRAVLLNPARQGGGTASIPQILIRFVLGSGGYFLLTGYLTMSQVSSSFGFAWLVLHGIVALFTRGHRGLTGLVTGLEVVDARLPAQRATVHSAE